jgi:hypothetical protein
VVSTSTLHERLIEKYGKPSYVIGDCGLDKEQLLLEPLGPSSGAWKCEEWWRSQGQVITLRWAYQDGRLSKLTLDYAPLPKDL